MLQLVKLALGLLNIFFGWLDRRQMLEAGKAQARDHASTEAHKRLSDALDNPVSDELRNKRFRDD